MKLSYIQKKKEMKWNAYLATGFESPFFNFKPTLLWGQVGELYHILNRDVEQQRERESETIPAASCVSQVFV